MPFTSPAVAGVDLQARRRRGRRPMARPTCSTIPAAAAAGDERRAERSPPSVYRPRRFVNAFDLSPERKMTLERTTSYIIPYRLRVRELPVDPILRSSADPTIRPGSPSRPPTSIVKCRWSPPASPVDAAPADRLAARDRVADLHVERRQVAVERLHAQPVVDDRRSCRRCRASSACSTLPSLAAATGTCAVDREVEPEVHLLVDFLALVDVGAVVGEARFDLRVAELDERLLPEPRRRRSASRTPRSARRSAAAARR